MAAPIKYDDLRSHWSRGQWKPHYLFTGQEDFLIEEAAQKAIHHWLGERPDAMSLERLDAETESVDAILQSLQTVSFFTGPRVIQVSHVADWSSADQSQVAEALPKLGPETHCLFVWGKEWRREDLRKPLVDNLANSGAAVIFWPPFPDQTIRWVQQRAAFHKKTIASNATVWLVNQSGSGLRLLDQELAKCADFVGNRTMIELGDVQTCFGYRKESSPFDWTTAVRRRRSMDALRVLHHLLLEGEEPVRLLALLSRSLRDWLSSKDSEESPALLAMRFHVKRGEENLFRQELDRWSDQDFVDGLEQSVEAEQKIKTGKETPEMALTLLTLSLTAGQSADAAR